MTGTTPQSRKEEQSEKAMEEMQRCTDWLVRFMRNKEPKFVTKGDLCRAAMEQLKVSKNSFNSAWINAIEETGRRDWYQPLRRRFRTKNHSGNLPLSDFCFKKGSPLNIAPWGDSI